MDEELMALAEAQGWLLSVEREQDDDEDYTVVRVLNPIDSVDFGDWAPTSRLNVGDIYQWRRLDPANPVEPSRSLWWCTHTGSFDSNTEIRIATLPKYVLVRKDDAETWAQNLTALLETAPLGVETARRVSEIVTSLNTAIAERDQ